MSTKIQSLILWGTPLKPMKLKYGARRVNVNYRHVKECMQGA